MAKRVNTHFVIMLGSGLVAAVAILCGVVWYVKRTSVIDPKILLAKAAEAHAAGDMAREMDMSDAAAKSMIVLANRSKSPIPTGGDNGADVLKARVADLAIKLSEKSKTAEEGLRYLQIHLRALRQAQEINPRNRDINEKLIEEAYAEATSQNDSRTWSFIEDEVTQYIKNQPAAPARMYTMRGEARLQWAEMASSKDFSETRFREIEQDLKKAIEMDPDAGKPVALYGRYQTLFALRTEKSSTPAEAESMREETRKNLKLFLDKHPNDPDVVLEYIDLLPNKRAPEAIELLKAAFAAHADNVSLGLQLSQAYMQSSPSQSDLAEKVLKDVIAAHPDEPRNYMRLGIFYQFNHNLAGALDTFKEGLNHINFGGYGLTQRHDLVQTQLFYNIASVHMDVAQAQGVDTADGKAAMTAAADYANRHRTAHGNKGLQDLLDGRAQLLNHNVPAAQALLHSADTNLANSAPEYVRLIKMLLAEASLQQRPEQLGSALEYYDQALNVQPVSALVVVQRSRVLLRLARYKEAQSAMEQLLARPEVASTTLVNTAKMVLAQALAGQGDIAGGTSQLDAVDTVPGLVQAAQLLLGAGETERALDKLNRALEKDASNLPALRLSLLAQLRLGKKDEAQKIVDRGLLVNKDNSEFQFFNAALKKQGEGTPVELQLKVIDSITDEYVKQLQIAGVYRQSQDHEKELAALQAAEATIKDPTTAEGRAKQEDIIDRCLSATVYAAVGADKDTDRAKYWTLAQTYVSKAERFNLDGLNGLLYRGRLDFMRAAILRTTKEADLPDDVRKLDPKGRDDLINKRLNAALALIEQAAAQRPDYAQAHTALAQAYLTVSPPKADAALQELRRSVHLLPNDIGLLSTTISLLTRTPTPANLQEAQTLLKQGMAMSPGDSGLAAFADLLGDQTQAIGRREALLKSNPADIENRRRLAILYTRSAQKDTTALGKAIALVRPLVEVPKPELSDTLFLAHLMAEDKKVDDALRLFEPFIAPTVDAAQRSQSLQALADFCKFVGKADLGEGYLKEAIRLQAPGDDSVDRHLGDYYYDLDDLAKAEEVYRSVYEKSKPGDPKSMVLRRLIEVLVRNNKCPEADTLLDTLILKERPDDAQGLVLRAYSRIQQGHAADALADLKVVLDRMKDLPEALYCRALANTALNQQVSESATDLLNLVGRYPSIPKYRILLAQLDRMMHKYGEAADQYAEILRQRPDLSDVRKEYAGFLMNLSLLQQRIAPDSLDDIALAIRRIQPVNALQDTLREGIALAPAEPLWVLIYGDLATVAGDVQMSKKLYEAVYQRFPDNATGVNSYARTLVALKAYDDAATVATSYLSKHPDSIDLYLRRASAYVGLKKEADAALDVDRAIGLAADAAHKSKRYAGYLAVIAQAAEILSPPGAIARLQARRGADPDDYLAGIGLLHTLVSSGRGGEAIDIVKSLKIPADDRVLQAMYLRESAMAYYAGKDLTSAIKQFTELLKIAPDDIEGLNNYAYILAEGMKKPKEALPHAAHAVKLIESSGDQSMMTLNSATIYDTYGWVKYLNGDFQGAIEQLQRAAGILPDSGVYLHLAQSYKGAHRETDARLAVEQGLKLSNPQDPSFVPLQQLQKELPAN